MEKISSCVLSSKFATANLLDGNKRTGRGIKIIYQDNDVMVIDKPAGLLVHPNLTQRSGTLVDILLKYYPEIKNVGEDHLRPGIVHRLDKDTSGVLVVAKNNQAFQWLKKQFQERKVIKKYLALVVGRPPQDKGTIRTYLARSPRKTNQKALSLPLSRGKIREAITKYKVIKKYKNYTLLELQPKTGRLHQIRTQLKWLGCPVAGDKKYKIKRQPCPEGLERQFLHACFLKLKLSNEGFKKFKSPLPPELKKVLKNLCV